VALTVGVVLAIAVGLLCSATGMDRDRALYPAVTFVVASYYVLFAAMGAPTRTLVIEALAGMAFVAAAVAGFSGSLWVVVLALAGHGGFDLVHGRVISNPGVPAWWPPFCMSYDVTAAAYLAWRLKSGRVRPQAPAGKPRTSDGP
jgi:hypothetical protein